MPTSLNKYLDPAALDETVVNIRELIEGLEEEMQDLPYARPDGLYPDMTVGSVIGADETAQWAQRESTGSGTAIVRSVQGAAVAWNQMLPAVTESDWTVSAATKNVVGNVAEVTPTAQYGRINYRGVDVVAGHSYLCALDYKILTNGSFSVYTSTNMQFTNVLGTVTGSDQWQHGAQILTANANNAGTNLLLNVQDNRASDWDTWSIKNVMLIDLTAMFGAGNEPQSVAEFEAMYPLPYYPYSAPTLKPVQIAGIASTDAQGGELDAIEWTAQTLRAAGTIRDELTADELVTRVGERAYQSGDESDATLSTDGITTYYPLTTPTTTPISPELPMTYRVEQGGTESIIVPAGEISAAPVLTVAEPVNAGDEFARIWASRGYTRNTAQLSRPVSLTDIGSIDEVQKDNADVTEIDTTKEVQE